MGERASRSDLFSCRSSRCRQCLQSASDGWHEFRCVGFPFWVYCKICTHVVVSEKQFCITPRRLPHFWRRNQVTNVMLLAAKSFRCIKSIHIVNYSSFFYGCKLVKEISSVVLITKLDQTGRVESETKWQYGAWNSISMLIPLRPVQ